MNTRAMTLFIISIIFIPLPLEKARADTLSRGGIKTAMKNDEYNFSSYARVVQRALINFQKRVGSLASSCQTTAIKDTVKELRAMFANVAKPGCAGTARARSPLSCGISKSVFINELKAQLEVQFALKHFGLSWFQNVDGDGDGDGDGNQ